jgi:hypothetical protein
MLYEGGMYCYAAVAGEADPNRGIHFEEVEIAGMDRCWESFGRLLGKLGKGQEKVLDDAVAVLMREPDSRQDKNAVAVYVLDARDDGHRVGYLAADDAENYALVIKQLERRTRSKVGCKARLCGRGTGLFARPVYECSLFLPRPDEWLEWQFAEKGR